MTATLHQFPRDRARRRVACYCGKDIGRRSVADLEPRFCSEGCAVDWYRENEPAKLAVAMKPMRGRA